MSVSTEGSDTINLFCNEAAEDSDASDTEITKIGLLSSLDFSVDEESYIDHIFDSERDQMPECVSLVNQLNPEAHSARKEAVNWLLKVHAYYHFKPETAYLSLNYMDRFLASRIFLPEKEWSLQLLVVACLSIAAKFEETSVPQMLDLQILGPKFLFRPNTVQRMELLVMECFKWRLHIVTPFCFLHHFIAKLCFVGNNSHDSSCVLSRASDLIIRTCSVINTSYYPPSTLAAAAILWLTNQTGNSKELANFHRRLNIEMVERCYNRIKLTQSQCLEIKVLDATVLGGSQARSNVTMH